jgi:putative ABC transport system substrate-binding protein
MSGRRGRAHSLRSLGVAAFLAAFTPVVAHASGVLVLRSSDLPVYGATARAFGAAFRRPAPEISIAGMDLDAAANEIARNRPDVVVAIGLRAASLAHERFPRVPLVYAMVPAPERHGLNGPTVTGVSAEVEPALELEVLHSLAPDVRRIGVAIGPGASDWIREASEAAERMELTLVIETASGVEQLGPRIRELAAHSDALWLPADPTVAAPEVFRLELAQSLSHRLPLLVFAPPLVNAGALAAAAPDLEWVGGRLADSVKRILAGERAGSIPATPVRRVRVVANLATARAIGRELPGAVLGDAEVVP